jgi:hypothetical protein
VHSSCDGGDLVRFAEKDDLKVGLEYQGRRGVVADPGLVVEPFRSADGIGGPPRDLVGEYQRRGKRIVCDGYQSWKRLGDAHVRYETPFDLQDGEVRVWRSLPDSSTRSG